MDNHHPKGPNMKKLVVSCKTADQVLEDFKRAAKVVRKGAFKGLT
jgi:hypothetical protein